MFFAQILLNSLVLGTQVLLLAISLYLIYAVSRVFHLSLGAIGTAIAYGLYVGVSRDLPLLGTIALVIGLVLLFGLLSYYILEPFVRKKEDMLAMIVSFSMLVAIESGIAMIFGSDGKSFFSGVLPTWNFGELYITFTGGITLIIGFVLAIVSAIVITKTPWGRILRSISENVHLVSSLAINARKVRLYVYILAGALAGLVVTLATMNTALAPRSAFDMLIMAFIALLIGGVRNIKGTIIASFIVTLVPEFIIGFSSAELAISASWKMFIVFVLALVLLSWRPDGLFAGKTRVG